MLASGSLSAGDDATRALGDKHVMLRGLQFADLETGDGLRRDLNFGGWSGFRKGAVEADRLSQRDTSSGPAAASQRTYQRLDSP
jgi:hypothetical protein